MSQTFYLLFTNKCIVFSMKKDFLPRYLKIIYFIILFYNKTTIFLLQVITSSECHATLWLDCSISPSDSTYVKPNHHSDPIVAGKPKQRWKFPLLIVHCSPCVFFLSQEVPGGVLLHHHREKQPPHAACGPQLCSGRLCHHQHQPSGQLLPLRPLPAQEVSGWSSAGPRIKLFSCTFFDLSLKTAWWKPW